MEVPVPSAQIVSVEHFPNELLRYSSYTLGHEPRRDSRHHQAVCAMTSERIKLKGPEFAHVAHRISKTSAHWLRHTAGSHMANNSVDLRHVRDNLGHASISTTSGHLHAPDDTRHNDTQGSTGQAGKSHRQSACAPPIHTSS
ncbi:site-specific integrase [Massilia timonae]|uniref:site-specific integrase n=1 Tax=Massilia timonae TaxID=47229 RepID=UPI0028D14D85|nr:site-specific integrase [Massilia timonae]